MSTIVLCRSASERTISWSWTSGARRWAPSGRLVRVTARGARSRLSAARPFSGSRRARGREVESASDARSA